MTNAYKQMIPNERKRVIARLNKMYMEVNCAHTLWASIEVAILRQKQRQAAPWWRPHPWQ